MCLDGTAPAFVMNDQATYVTKTQRMCEALHEGKIEVLVSPTISSSSQSCTLDMPDGARQRRDFDAVVFCTGFCTSFPWLKLKGFDTNPRSWYLYCFPEGVGHCLFFVGYARPHQGGIPAMAELLSRYIALLLRGEKVLPLDYAAQARRDAEAEREYYFMRPNLHTLVDYNAFLESVARRVGCEPRLPIVCILLFNLHMLAVLLLLLEWFGMNMNPLGLWPASLLWAGTMAGFILFNNGLLIKWWFYPQWPMWYRQRGPGAVTTLPGIILRRVNLWKSTTITRGFVLLILRSVPTFYAQRLLSPLMFPLHVILDALGFRFPKAFGGLLRPKIFVLHGNRWRLSDLFLP